MKNGRFFLMAALALTAQAHADNEATLIVSPNVKYQHIDGFGAAGMSGQWGDVFTDDMVRRLWGTADGQVGLNIMRVRIAPGEDDWADRNAGYAKPIRTARNVNPSLTVFATPWTPPYKYKTHNDEKYQNSFGTTVYPSWLAWGFMPNGGAINPDCYADYADFLERYRQMMESHDATVDIISIQNESDYTPTDDDHTQATYESCIYSPSEMAAMAKAARAKIDPKCRIMSPECYGWDQHKYNRQLLQLKDATDNIDIWGNHIYGTNDWTYIDEVTKKTGKKMWMTEFYVAHPEDYNGEFNAEYAMIESLEKSLQSGFSAYVYWGADGAFFTGDDHSGLSKRAYVFSHYAHYATGMQRVKATLTGNTGGLIGGSTYASEQGDTITVFVCNKSSDVCQLTVSLAFAPKKIMQVVTGDAANSRRTDVTERFDNGTRRPVVTLMPGHFYTFQFLKNADEERQLATSPKKPQNGNPLIVHNMVADPTAVVYNGRLYVYGTNDQQEFDYSDGLFGNSYLHIGQLYCISTTDMVNWTDHGIIDVKKLAPWAWSSWAPSIVSRKDKEGKTHFYLYYTTGSTSIGVLTADSPEGPWHDPLGHALINENTPGLGVYTNLLDPGVAINDDETEAYITFGGGSPNSEGSNFQPGNVRIAKLGDDMISLVGDVKRISAPYHWEANELNYIGGQWVYSYCTGWGGRENWAEYTQQQGISVAPPSTCSMAYMTATDPMADNWKYRGEYLPNPGPLGYPWGNNHTHIHKYKDRYYLLYHTQWLEQQLGVGGGYRVLHANRMNVTESTASLPLMKASNVSLMGVSQLTDARINPFEEQSGAMAAIKTRDWWMVRGLDFRKGEQPARELILRVKGTGTLEVRMPSLDSQPIAMASFSTGYGDETITVPLNDTPQGLCNYVYFVLPHVVGSEAEVVSWQFSTDDASAITTLTAPATPQPVYNLKGQYVGNAGHYEALPRDMILISGGRKFVRH